MTNTQREYEAQCKVRAAEAAYYMAPDEERHNAYSAVNVRLYRALAELSDLRYRQARAARMRIMRRA